LILQSNASLPSNTISNSRDSIFGNSKVIDYRPNPQIENVPAEGRFPALEQGRGKREKEEYNLQIEQPCVL
jgi:hypothetical protein